MYDIYFDFLGNTVSILTGYEPDDFVEGFWIRIDDDGGFHIAEKMEEAEYLIPPHRIVTFRKIKEGE